MSSSTIGFAILLGIANPIPSTSVAPIFTVLIPMTLPDAAINPGNSGGALV